MPSKKNPDGEKAGMSEEVQIRRVPACVRREFVGGGEDLTFEAWVGTCIQDVDAACDIAQRMLDQASDAYAENEHDPEFVEQYTILDVETFKSELDRVLAEDC